MAAPKHSYRCTFLTYTRYPDQFKHRPPCDCGADIETIRRLFTEVRGALIDLKATVKYVPFGESAALTASLDAQEELLKALEGPPLMDRTPEDSRDQTQNEGGQDGR